jgi:hypothetical protein
MNLKPITGSPLRQSMIEQMELRGLARRSIKTYVGWVSALSGQTRRNPARIGNPELSGSAHANPGTGNPHRAHRTALRNRPVRLPPLPHRPDGTCANSPGPSLPRSAPIMNPPS